MLPLTESQMRQFVQMRLPEQGNLMLQQLGDRLRKFGDTPLLLSMLCDVFSANGKVPANLGSAFRDFANLYDGRLKENVPVYEYSRSHWSRLLQQLAFAMMPQDRPEGLRLSISRSEAEEILTRFLDGEKFPKPRDYAHHWLEDLLKHHLLQIKFVGTDQEIEFRHQLIQEYYAAEYLLPLFPKFTDIKLQHSYLNYLDWTESLALMLELVESEEQAVRVVRLALEVDLRLGARLAGAIKYGFQERTVGLLIQTMDERKIPKLYAIELLAETRSDKSVESLILALKDSDNFVRRNAAEALGKIGSDKAVEALILALKDSDNVVRRNAVRALGNIGSDKAVKPLIEALKDSDDDVRRNATEALERIGNDKVFDSLIFALNDSNDYVRSNALETLSKIGNDKFFDSLIFALNDSNDYVRSNALEILSKIGNDKIVDSLVLALNDSDDVRIKALAALGKTGSEKAIDHLVLALNDSGDDVRRNVIVALGKIGSDK
ncbi:MAG: HEAT repeat domain-containing protein, partial [Pseudanabaena sp.]